MRKKLVLVCTVLIIGLASFLFFISAVNRNLGNLLPAVPLEQLNPSDNNLDVTNDDNVDHTPRETDENDIDINEDVIDADDYLPDPPAVIDECLPENFSGFEYDILVDGVPTDNYNRETSIYFSQDVDYTSLAGITTFRGNNLRNNSSYGYAKVIEKKLESVWFAKTGYIDSWTGVGWTGQPAIIKWPGEMRETMNIYPEKKMKENLTEIIYATLDGKIYFLDIDDGQPTRPAIDVGYPHKGSVTVDPRGYPLLYAGQGIQENNGRIGPFYFRIFSLINQQEIFHIDGYEEFAYRRWGAFDSSPLVHAETDTLILPGENGIVYTVKLNTEFDLGQGTLSLNPEIVRYRYRSPYGSRIGIESSPAVFADRLFFADNSGLLQSIDINTMKPIWLRNVDDDTDSTIAIEEINKSEAYLYTANEVDHQGEGGFCYIRKLNAFSGELIWEKPIECVYDPQINGGAFASPVIGTNNIDDLVIFNIARPTDNKFGGILLALDKITGETVWEVSLDYYCWSSPTAVYTKEGNAYLLVCDSGGYMRLFDAMIGEQLDVIGVEANVEASPAVFDNMIIVGTRGQKILGIRLK